ncbi:uncharacterized protein V2V93DRAFT_362824 [Kockiozyma suomiensis]|uniref:uncharacterized protein n=1 Tax=Kockiozyma suomiensis TaxID=1337062 RepID=UPI0033434DA2
MSSSANRSADYDALIDVDAEGGMDLGETDLEFHDFHTGDNIQGKIPASQTRYEPPTSIENDPDRPVSIWSIRFYQQFFDVETGDVTRRCLYALYPRVSFLETIGDNPDLYGPFWIASTVIVVLFFSSTIAGAIASHVAGVRYEYNFGLLSAAAALMYGYTFVVPIILWGVLKWYKSENARLLDCVALYGYANTIWVPVALVSTSPIEIFNFPTISNVVRWICTAIGFAVSTTFLVRNLYPTLMSTEAKTARILLVAVVLGHVVLAFVVKLVFFAYSIEDNTAN